MRFPYQLGFLHIPCLTTICLLLLVLLAKWNLFLYTQRFKTPKVISDGTVSIYEPGQERPQDQEGASPSVQQQMYRHRPWGRQRARKTTLHHTHSEECALPGVQYGICLPPLPFRSLHSRGCLSLGERKRSRRVVSITLLLYFHTAFWWY